MADIILTVDSSQVTNATKQVDKLSGAVTNTGNSSQAATRKMSSMGVAVQQTGYQVGDFLVQVQSGTNWMVAFGQQATQLVGILPMMSKQLGMSVGALVGLSAGLGIAIPLVTAVGAYFMRTGGDAKSMADRLKDLESAVKNYSDALEAAQNPTQAIQKEFGVTSDLLRSLVRDFEELAKIRVAEEIGGSIAKLREDHLQGFESDIENIKDLLGMEGWFDAASGEVAQFDSLLLTMESSSASLETKLKAALDLREILIENAGGLKNLDGLALAFYNDLLIITQQMEVFRKQQEGSEDSLRTQVSHQQQIATIQKDINDQRAEYREAVNQAENSLKQQIALNMKILQYGENSLAVERLKAEQAREAYRQELLNDGIRGNHLTKLMELYDRQVKLEGKVSDTADEAERFSTILEMADLSHLVDQSASLAANMADAADNAAAALAARTLDVANAANIQYAGRGTTSSRPAFQMDDQGRITTVSSILRDQESARKKAAEGSSKQSPTEQAEEYIQKLEREAEFKSTLVGLSDEQAAIETRREQLINQLNGYEEGLSDTYSERIEQIIQAEAETRKLIEAEQQREQLMQTIEGHIENAFMSMVDGSKSVEDAFKSMLRNIILAIYQQKVAEPAAKALGGLFDTAIKAIFPSANGNVFLNGSHVQAYASGGVVNRATMFPMRSGVGIMGEAGPEAIMPLKRGKNGKLGVQMEGSSQPVVVNQYFNMSANGDESVKRIIRQETPRIAEQAKAAVVDAKRRGGSYGRSF